MGVNACVPERTIELSSEAYVSTRMIRGYPPRLIATVLYVQRQLAADGV